MLLPPLVVTALDVPAKKPLRAKNEQAPPDRSVASGMLNLSLATTVVTLPPDTFTVPTAGPAAVDLYRQPIPVASLNTRNEAPMRLSWTPVMLGRVPVKPR